jgi:hypothetical protein
MALRKVCIPTPQTGPCGSGGLVNGGADGAGLALLSQPAAELAAFSGDQAAGIYLPVLAGERMRDWNEAADQIQSCLQDR